MQFAKLNNINLHYQEFGAPEGKPLIVFINSLGTDFRIWRDVVIRFVGEAEVLTYDKRGHGLSEIGATPYSIEDHASDIAALMDKLGKRNAIIVGLSVGGLIAQSLYKSRPDLVRALVLADTAMKIATAEFWNDRISSVEIGGMVSLAEATMRRWFTERFLRENTNEVAGYRTMLARQPIEGYLATCTAIRDADYTADAAVIAVPVMCVVGVADATTTPAHVYEMANAISDARYEEIKDAAHLPCIEQPDAFADLLKDFIKNMDQQIVDSLPDGASLH